MVGATFFVFALRKIFDKWYKIEEYGAEARKTHGNCNEFSESDCGLETLKENEREETLVPKEMLRIIFFHRHR